MVSHETRKKGFRLKSLPEDAYKGQQQKLKQNLIQKAKLKKNYAKILRQEAESGSEDLLHKSKNVVNSPSDTTFKTANDDAPKQRSVISDFAKFDDEDEDDAEDKTDVEVPKHTNTKDEPLGQKSYRQRLKLRKADPSAAKAASIKDERERDRELAIAKRQQIERKRSDRNDIKKRELSRTKKGQPLMKDRMKNILDKLQASA